MALGGIEATTTTAASVVPVLTAAFVVLVVLVFMKSKRSSKKTVKKVAMSAEELLAAADPEQKRMMEERVILLDDDDNVTGHASKRESHEMVNINKGMLHRAFSVFMFNRAGQLLLQKRSEEKVTFPSYWANTCCSHPLFVEDELKPGKEGVINAARRKLLQELGITPDQVPADCFQFLTRVHYKAASDGVWGEHEIDYILVCRPPKDPVLNINANEVAEVRYFNPTDLREWVNSSETRGDLVSPWFRIIERTLLHRWWTAVMTGDVSKFKDDKIHRAGDFDSQESSATASFRSAAAAGSGAGSGNSTNNSTEAAAVKKQGAYGKVPTHTDSIFKQLLHVDEVIAALRFKRIASRNAKKGLPAGFTDDDAFCDMMLCRVSRSFAAVIQQLPDGLRRATCVFYLVLRGLDTVEDDMQAFDSVATKVAELNAFSSHLEDPDWKMHGVGEGDEARLLEQFGGVVRSYQSLPKAQRAVIRDITDRMAAGMAHFIDRDLKQGTKDGADYDLYCHYVAGLVGEGLSSLFVASGREHESVAKNLQLSNDMGLFLQKTNIIRDYLEDFVDERAFWPATIWKKHADNLGDFCYGKNRRAGLACLNEMVTDGLRHAPQCLRYMKQLKDKSVFGFCAVPQVMAIATMDKCFNNAQVFTGVVKIRKGTACKLIMNCKNMEDLYTIFLDYSRSIRSKVNRRDPCARETIAALDAIEHECLANLPPQARYNCFNAGTVVCSLLFVVLAWSLKDRSQHWDGNMPRLTNSVDVALVAAAAFCFVYLLSFTGVAFVESLRPSDVSTQKKLAASSSPTAAGARQTVRLVH